MAFDAYQPNSTTIEVSSTIDTMSISHRFMHSRRGLLDKIGEFIDGIDEKRKGKVERDHDDDDDDDDHGRGSGSGGGGGGGGGDRGTLWLKL